MAKIEHFLNLNLKIVKYTFYLCYITYYTIKV